MQNSPLYQQVKGKFTIKASVRCVKRTTVLSEELDQWCGQVADELGDKFGYRQFGKSTVINNAVEFYRDFYVIHENLISHKRDILSIFKLPNDRRQLAFNLISRI